jgi:5-formyltetrahydrofolate cyclo-ligase
MESLSEKKKHIRTQCLERRSEFIRSYERHTVHQNLAQNALTWDKFINPSFSTVIAGYWPKPNEADPRLLLSLLEQKGYPLCLPCVSGENLIFRQWHSHSVLTPGLFEIYEPHSDAQPLLPSLVIVPLVGFHRQGGRIGYGLGYYDRALSALKKIHKVHTLGIAYGCQEILEEAPQEPYDILLDAIATENELIIC